MNSYQIIKSDYRSPLFKKDSKTFRRDKERQMCEFTSKALLATVMLRNSIIDYRKGDKGAKRFLFEKDYLRDFLDCLGFSNIRLDLLREKIKQGDKLVKLC